MRASARAIAGARALSAIALLLAPACALPAAEAAVDGGFTPGRREIFFDDFSHTDVGAFPSNWTLKGPGAGGNPLAAVERGGARFLLSQTPAEGEQQTPSTLYARLPKDYNLPLGFTIEFDAVFGYSRLANDLQAEKQYDILVGSAAASYSLLAVTSQRAFSRNGQANLDLSVGNVHHIAVTVQGRSVRAYVDGRRVIDDPDGAERPIGRVGLQLSSYKGVRQEDLMFTNFRIAEADRPQSAR
jgi:hypothetical protein